MDSFPSRNLIGAVLSRRYRLVKQLGEGGMGEVYAAEPLDHGPQVAIKMLLPEFHLQPTILARFLDEARACKRLSHPNIIRIFDAAEAEDGTPYLVMELLQGVPLSAYMEAPIPLARAVPILQGMLAGLGVAHAQGIIHRDLKPDNVFLHRDATGHFVVKLLDFGIAKVMDLAGGMGSKTRTGVLLGTPAYMSPEQIKSARDVDVRADLWSAAVMFYEMITGHVAFPAPTEYARLTSVLMNTPDAVETVDPQLFPVGPFMKKALEKDRDKRFQNAAEMARALSLAMGNISRAEALPLSRLSDPVAGAPFLSPTLMAGTAPTELAHPVVIKAAGGSTLSSPTGPAGKAEVAPIVVVAHPPLRPLESTMPSQPETHDVRAIGVAPVLVVGLVAGALFAGFLLGFAVARF
ncbi:MAG: serine/threonine-protein kinase [Myxococcales bacterium]